MPKTLYVGKDQGYAILLGKLINPRTKPGQDFFMDIMRSFILLQLSPSVASASIPGCNYSYRNALTGLAVAMV